MTSITISIDNDELALVAIKAIAKHLNAVSHGAESEFPAVLTASQGWVDTAAMANELGISVRTIHHYRGKKHSPWIEGRHYKRMSPSDRSPWVWNQKLTTKAWQEECK